jgi:outer membrane protein assembly factor BamB
LAGFVAKAAGRVRMKINRRLLWIIIFVVATASIGIFYSTSAILQSSATNFPLGKLWSQNLNSEAVDISTSSDISKILVRTNSVLFVMEPADGKIVWSSPLAKQVHHSPARTAAKMVFVTDNDSLQALSISDGKLVWKQLLPQTSGRLVDLSESLVIVNQASHDIRAYDTQSGQLLWSVPAGRGLVQAYINGDMVYIADHGISAIKAATGESVWQYGNSTIGASASSDGIIYYTSGNKVTAFDTETRNELWNVNLPDNGFLRFKLDNKCLFIMDESNFYLLDRSDGTLLWQADISHPMNPVIIANNIYVMEGFSRVIRVFNFATEAQIGHMRISVPHLLVAEKQDMFSVGDTLIFSTGQHVFAYK